MIPELEEKAEYNPELLLDFLNDAVMRSYWFVAIVTPGYLVKPTTSNKVWWTLCEWEQAIELGTPRSRDSEELMTQERISSGYTLWRWKLYEDEEYRGFRRIAIPLLDRSEPKYQEMLSVGGAEEVYLGKNPGVEKISVTLERIISGDKTRR